MEKGNPVSEGIAIAPAYVYKPMDDTVKEAFLAPEAAPQAVNAVDSAIELADAELCALIGSFSAEEAEQAKIFAAHREILRDEALHEAILDAINGEHQTAEYAVFTACQMFIDLLSQAGDANIAMRTADVRDVQNRLVRCLRGEQAQGLSRLAGNCILVAHDLLPSDTASMDRAHVLGVVTETGGATSHTTILARSFRIPALVGVSGASELIRTGDMLLLDALAGELTIRPNEAAQKAGERKRETWLAERTEQDAFLRVKAQTQDGVRVEIGLNIGSDQDEIPDYVDFVGLFRTEFLYMNSDHLPTEGEQFAAYRRVLERAQGKPVTLRTLDVGGDKKLPYLALPQEENPFLGKRALRLCFDETALFDTQLRAALRASAYGELWLMLPMVGSLDDIRRAKATISEIKAELDSARVPYGKDCKLGIMIEIPSIALVADLAAQEVDFASIGTNDLCQYTCAVDRMNPAVAPYYQSLSPAMVRIMGMAIRAFRDAGKPISVCGELGGNPDAAALLVGLGLRKLSMSASNVARVKQRLTQTRIDEAERLAKEAALSRTQEAVLALLR